MIIPFSQLKIIRSLFYIIVFLLIPSNFLFGLQNNTGAHDPTAIQKCDKTYWIYSTGDGISAKYSRDLINWTSGRSPLSKSLYPAWINDYVPGFDGHFWAPECIFMNGKYYLYYSCSTWGSKNSCIGLLTNKTLNPENPDFLWEDEGVVVYSNSSSEANCIDPAVFADENGDYYLSYGSYFGGIRIIQLDSISGKVNGSYYYPVASGNCEASYVIYHDSYYFLFINRGSCCQGVNSTYHIQVGRSLSPTGPFLDKTGINLNSGGGTTIFSTNGSVIGPGHLGYYVEDGTEWVTYHFYDGDRNGAPTLAIATMQWEAEGWPRITNDFIEEGEYILVNHNSQMVMQAVNANEMDSPLTQGTYLHQANQILHLIPVGNGYYSIGLGEIGLVAKPVECSSSSGTSLIVGTDNFMPCEHWKFERTNQLEYVISSRAGNNVINVPNPAFEEGTQLQTAIYSGIASHYWSVKDTSVMVGGPTKLSLEGPEFLLYPNPVSGGSFTINMLQAQDDDVILEIYTMGGRLVFREVRKNDYKFRVEQALPAGIYTVRVIAGKGIRDNKITVL